jgi:hypothetical protein
MKRLFWILTFALLPTLLFAGCESGGPAAPTVQSRGIVQGTVLADNGNAVAGADILVDGEATGVETDKSGHFEVSVAAGEHLITVVAEGVKSRPYAVEGGEDREIVIELIPGEAPPLSDEEICELYPHECEEPPKDEPPMSDEEFCKRYPWECEEQPGDKPPKDEPPMSDEEFCKRYPWECEEQPGNEPPKDEPPMSDEEFCELYPSECEEPPSGEPM